MNFIKPLFYSTLTLSLSLLACTEGAKSKAVLISNDSASTLKDNAPKGEEESNRPPVLGTRKGITFGETFSPTGAITPQVMKEKLSALNGNTLSATVRGEVVDVCQAEGCWLNMDAGDGTVMRVDMHDHSFLVPEDVSGRIAIVQGIARYDTTSVADLRHYAEDDKKTPAEIAKITEPEVDLVFDAKGILFE